ncbi:NADH-quinone oxidoreductase subunit L [Planosporangium flavigriseum]|uniref:NADH dehydrogenase n=1 Tax=Planosporangium flavigriseum TaxID=373681 RepID=A0A8J3PMN4_9ACTN|nr:NADH-quinone oxidoreductase subunit L [Planosporangium flavigriseum]NJC64730.1 NADH-quinone oxidoreductase subunit L [Planosporangium flavigriseum]GIG74043.1 NADH dehydrogenase [Planosporangium flavigriseum]
MSAATLTAAGALLPAVPFLVALMGLLLPRAPRPVAAALGIGGAAVALAVAVVLAANVNGPVEASRRWADFGDISVTIGVRLDPVAVLVAVAVAAVALAVQVYSTAYLKDDDRYGPYAAQVSLFTAAMLLVVVAGDLIELLVGWEVMGICSYLLIGHDRRLPEAPRAAVKAFLVTRVGDVGFLLGIALLGVKLGTFRITDVLANAHKLSSGEITVITLLLLAGVAGKSAQFPLHTWLPDAMAGPTPISALIHAATMVAAGVYVVARLFPLFHRAPATLATLAVVASITMLLGALAACAQGDIKRVLAWSTVSQIGYMTGALAVGAPPAALFHLLTHAAFKALLFLTAGAIIHAVGTNLMAAMGGLRRSMPVTFWSMTIGLAALVGVPPLGGFWSKDEIISVAWAGRLDGPAPTWAAWLVWVSAIGTVAVTAWYATRLWLRTFFGAPRGLADAHPHEPPAAMTVPVLLLAVPSALLGFAGLAPGFMRRLGFAGPVHLTGALFVPLAFVAVGIVAAWLMWRRDPAADPARVLGPARPVLAEAFYLDAVQEALVVRPMAALARAVRRTDETVVDGAVEATGRGTSDLGALLGRAHRAALPRAATAVLAGAVLFGLVAALIFGGMR